MSKKSKDDIVNELGAAVRLISSQQGSGPGVWKVEGGPNGQVCLWYELEIDEYENAPHRGLYENKNAIWESWGGDRLLSAAKMDAENFSADAYVDRFGSRIYGEYCYFDCEEE
jgi:hypothetical protein